MKTLILTFLAVLFLHEANAQYGWSPYLVVNTTSNYAVLANTNITYNAGAALGGGNKALIQMSYSLTATNASGTNPITANFQKSIDGSLWTTNVFSLSVTAVTNTVVWGSTNVDVSDAVWLRVSTLTNGNAVSATNVVVLIGQKRGL